jgi:hypothetical protein
MVEMTDVQMNGLTMACFDAHYIGPHQLQNMREAARQQVKAARQLPQRLAYA